MTPSNSSTSSSDQPPIGRSSDRATVAGAVAAIAWTLLFLIGADVALARVFRSPTDPKIEPTTLQRYFEYGRSVEGKLRLMVPRDDAKTALIAKVGWLRDPERPAAAQKVSQPGHLLVATYGQSFTNHLFENVVKLDPRIEVHVQSGPAAPLGHSYALYQGDRKEQQADIVVMGVLASALPQLVTLTPMTWGFEAPTPYTYPRYRLLNGQLTSVPAPLESLDDLRATLDEPVRWSAFVNTLASEDAAFDSFLFNADILDHSTFGRLLRRAVGHQHQSAFTARYHDTKGFLNRDGIIDVGRALLQDFGKTAAADGRLPFVILFDDRGYPGHLKAAFADTLAHAAIPYLSSNDIAPAADLTNFVPDGHFTPKIERELAKQWLDRIYELRPAFRASPATE